MSIEKQELLGMKRSSDEIYAQLLLNYKLAILKTEMDIHKARYTRSDTKMSRYFNSTPIKYSFARWMCFATYAKRFYMISELEKEMFVTRQTISGVIKDCEDAGWIIVKRTKSNTKCQASPELIERMEEYIGWRRTIAKDTIGQAFIALNSFEKLMSKQFT